MATHTAKSRLGLARPAVRPAMNGRVLLSGPSGAGKTWTSLAIAETIVTPGSRILLIDTEKESALTYADEFVDNDGNPIFEHLPWAAPFDPRDLTVTLNEASGVYRAVIIDSFTHFWRGSGGILDIANGKFTGWADARPIQVDIVEAILRCDAHVILCAREKMAHQQVQDGDKWKVVKLGMEVVQDADLEYEMNVSITMDMQHTMQVAKSRTAAVPVGTTFHAGHAADFAVLYRDWLAAGEPVATRDQTDALVEALNRIEDEGARVKSKRAFVDEFGRPEFLLSSRLDEAKTWVADVVLAAAGGPVTGNATEGADAAPDESAPDAAQASLDDSSGGSSSNGTATAQAGAQPASQAATTGVDAREAEIRAKTVEHVASLTPTAVRKKLSDEGLSRAGTNAQRGKRLEDFLVREVLAATAEKADAPAPA